MNLVVPVASPEEGVETFFGSSLTGERLGEVIENGIKFFLFQRGQIATPYDSLERATVAVAREVELKSMEVERNIMHGVNCENEDGRSNSERILAQRNERKARLTKMRLERKLRKLSMMEKKIRGVWDDVFKLLRSVLCQLPRNDIHSVGLLFGSSVYNPKEMVMFRVLAREACENSDEVPTKFQTYLRNFLKAIIMSQEYLDFTEKPLRSTGCHVCIWTKTQFDSFDSAACDKLLRLDSLDAMWNCDTNVTDNLRHLKAKKFSIKLSATKESAGGSPSSSDTNKTSVDSDIQSNSLFCYQLPFRFRGIPSSGNT